MPLRRYLRRLIGIAGGLLLRLLYTTLRISIQGARPQPGSLIAFSHGEQLCLYGGVPAGPVVAPVSLSRDGDIQVGVLSCFGITSIRGSSSKNALSLTRALYRSLNTGYCALVAVDGPRGPRGVPKNGVFYLARKAKVPIFPVIAKARRSWVLRNTWDHFQIPKPFSSIQVVFGRPILIDASRSLDSAAEEYVVAISELKANT